MRMLAILSGLVAVGLASQPALSCTCPKEKLVQEYGTVSLLGGLQKPRPGPLRPVSAEAPRPALGPIPLWPIGEKPQPGRGLADPPGGFFTISLPEP